MREYSKRWKPGCDFNKNRNLKHKYGITLDQYQQMLVLQNNLCLLCKQTFDFNDNVGYGSPVIDHDHGCCSGTKSCGKCIRGVIHRRCNIGLGAFSDDAVQLRLAAEYLEKFNVKS